uniref:Uncharacterized protein n=1 Tax=Salix viminalis TaxID=40686 RepID=A0A6N2KAK8_SALVM
MKEIIGGTRSDEKGVMGKRSNKFKLPKLRELRLLGLPELKNICRAKLICDSLETIALINLSGEDLSGEDFQVMFPKDIQQLIINKCLDATSLCDVFSLINYATKLEDIVITQCNSMESLVSSSWFFSTPSPNGIFSGLKNDCLVRG